MPNTSRPPKWLVALGRDLGFGPADLTENRAGQLSLRQVRKVKQTIQLAWGLTIGAGVGGLALGLVAWAGTWLQAPWQWGAFGAAELLFLGLLISSFLGVRERAADLAGGRVALLDARLKARKQLGGFYFVALGALEFPISRETYQQLPTTETWCRVYFTPRSKMLMAMELSP